MTFHENFFLVNTALPAWITKIPHFRSLMSFTQPLYKFPWSLLFPIKKMYWHLSLFYSFVFLPLLGKGKNKLTLALFDSCRVIPTRLYKNYFWLCYMFNSLFFSFFSIWIKTPSCSWLPLLFNNFRLYHRKEILETKEKLREITKGLWKSNEFDCV